MHQAVCCILLAASLTAAAGGVLDTTVTRDAGVFTMAIQASIDAPPAMVYRLITDYDHLNQVNPSVRESRILKRYNAAEHRVLTVTRVCVLFYCRDIKQVQDMVQRNGNRLEAVILPELSDFRRGTAAWRLSGSGNHTFMEFTAEIEPDFFVPPFLGTWLIRREMHSQMTEIITVIETRVRRQGAG